MSPETKRKIQVVLLVAIAIAGIRAAYVVYQRRGDRQAAEAPKKEETKPKQINIAVK